MAEFTAKDVMKLREQTGAGMMDCKRALVDADGDMEKAADLLRERGIAKAAKRASKIAAEGIVYALVEGKVGVLVEVNCESDFVAKGDKFKELVNAVAKQIAAKKPATVEELLASDMGGKTVKEVKSALKFEEGNLLNPSEQLDVIHFRNWFDAIRKGEKLNSGIVDACISTQLVQLGNIAQRVGRSLRIDPTTGRILDDREAGDLWGRTYEKGWEIRV